MTKTMKKVLGIALSASMIASCFTGMSIPASAEGESTYTITIPSALTVENSGWNSIGNISASGTLEDGKKLNITATSLNNFALKSGDNSVSYTIKNDSTDTIDFWFVLNVNNGVLYIPVSKIDRQVNEFIVPSQVVNSFYENGRMILRKTAKETVTIPRGGIFVPRN